VGDVNVSEDTYQWLSLFWFFGVEHGKQKTERENTEQAEEQNKQTEKERQGRKKEDSFL
jgi:hypothetical protein